MTLGPVAGITLLLGVDRFMSEMRTVTNLIGNGVATIVIARWENEFDDRKAQRVLNRVLSDEQDRVLIDEQEIEEEQLKAEKSVVSF
jgi:aerobic C4-dicarboxylate transport protein